MQAMAKTTGRRGRKRNLDTRRQPDGRVKPEAVGPAQATLDRRIDDLSAMIVKYPRTFAQPLALQADSSWYIGRLYLCGQVSLRQKDAAERFLRAVRAYESILGAPKLPCAMDMNRVNGATTEDDKTHTRRFKRARAAYERMQRAVSNCGHDVMRAVTDALRGVEVDLELLKKGLDALGTV